MEREREKEERREREENVSAISQLLTKQLRD